MGKSQDDAKIEDEPTRVWGWIMECITHETATSMLWNIGAMFTCLLPPKRYDNGCKGVS